MGQITNEEWQMIKNNKIGDKNQVTFFRVGCRTSMNCISVEKMFGGISVNNVDFYNLDDKGIANGGLVVKFNKMLPDLDNSICSVWEFDVTNGSLHIQTPRYDDIFYVVDDNLGYFIDDFGGPGDHDVALESLMARIGEFYM